MRYLLSVILSLFCFIIPVYAAPDDFLLENSDNVNNTAYYDLSDTNDIYRGSFDSIVRSPSINPDVSFQYLGFDLVRVDDENCYLSVNFEGQLPSEYTGFIFGGTFELSDGSIVDSRSATSPNFITTSNLKSGTIERIRFRSLSGVGDLISTYNYHFDTSTPNSTIGIDVPTASYLSQVTQIFSWLLTSIGTLIVFIIGNPFLAVMLCLFLAGSVISFFIRIRG